MYGQEANELFEAFIDLMENFRTGTVCAFLEACWLLPDTQSFAQTTLERIIYSEGDSHEVFTRPERDIIKNNQGDIYCARITLETNKRSVDGRFFAVELKSSDTVYDSIAIMKLISKAIDGFNVFLFVSQKGVHIGCSSLSRENSYHDCTLSPIINSQINWERLYDILIFRADSRKLTEYYCEIVNICEGIKTCYLSTEDSDLYKSAQWDYDCEDYLEDIRHFDFEDYLNKSEYIEQDDTKFNAEVFENEVEFCMRDLSFIEKTHVNPLELLFEAEKEMLIAEQQASEEDTDFDSTTQEDDLADIDLLDDPIALMKKLKIERGI